MIASLKKYRLSRWQYFGVLLFFLLALFQAVLATSDYVICTEGSGIFLVDKQSCSSGIKGLIPYKSSDMDKSNRAVSPFAQQDVSSLYYRHWLGTDSLGRDVLAGLLAGCWVALRIGILAMLLTIIIGSFFGYLSGYLGDKNVKLNYLELGLLLLLFSLSIFYLVYGSSIAKLFSIALLLVVFVFILRKAGHNSYNNKLINIPFDMLVMRFIEIFRAIPDIFFILVMIGIVREPSITSIVFMIAIVRWPSVARFVRAEIMKIKEEPFVLSARALGLSSFKVFKDHILPLSLSPVIIASAFGVSTAILLESTLSFLGIGIPLNQVTWGSMLNDARQNISMWWLALFPGLMIYFVIYLFNSIGDTVSEQFRGE